VLGAKGERLFKEPSVLAMAFQTRSDSGSLDGESVIAIA
jgi:hypothetical protein